MGAYGTQPPTPSGAGKHRAALPHVNRFCGGNCGPEREMVALVGPPSRESRPPRAFPPGQPGVGTGAPAWTDERVLFVLTTPLPRRQQAPRAKGQAPVCARRAWPDASELSKARHPVEASR